MLAAGWSENRLDDRARKPLRVQAQGLLGVCDFTLEFGLGGLDLLVGVASCFCYGRSADILRGIPTRFSGTKYRQLRFTETILVFAGLRLSGRNIGTCALNGPLSTAATLFQDALQGLVHQEVVHGVKQQKQHGRRKRPEQ
jgi:hypothetical protein